MRRVTAGAARVAGGHCVLVGMALRAALVRCVLGFVHAVAVEAAAQTCMRRLLGHVAARARLRIERWRSMCMVAMTARLIGVCTDRVLAVLPAIVAIHARRSDTGREGMAVLAARRVDAGMQRRQLARMAALADARRRRREAGVAVTGLARDLANMRDVTGACRDRVICRRHLFGDAVFTGRAASQKREHGENADHGRDPIG
jgi:hypothetical protein